MAFIPTLPALENLAPASQKPSLVWPPAKHEPVTQSKHWYGWGNLDREVKLLAGALAERWNYHTKGTAEVPLSMRLKWGE